MTKKISKTAKAVMKRIKKQEVKMKPRAYFVLGSMLLGVGITGVLLVTVLLVGVIFFRLRMGGAMGHLRQGVPGLIFFTRVFPWKIAGLAGVSFGGGSWLLKRHDKAYKVGLGWLVLGAVIAVVGLGFLLDKAGVNERLQRAKSLKPMYEMRLEDKGFSPRPEMMNPGMGIPKRNRVK